MGTKFIPALGFAILTPIYQWIVNLFCRDTYIKNIVANLVSNDRTCRDILDIACGPGKLVYMLADNSSLQNVQITGMDIDPVMVKAATKTLRDVPSARVIQGDATKTAFQDSSFDIVIESLMFHHLSDKQKQLAIYEINRVLRDGGNFYFVDWVQPKSCFTKLMFNIVKFIDGSANVESHENGVVMKMIHDIIPMKEGFDPIFIDTLIGTIGILQFQKRK